MACWRCASSTRWITCRASCSSITCRRSSATWCARNSRSSGVIPKPLSPDVPSPGNPMSERLRLVFAGTPEFAVPSLHACLSASGCEVVAVYTQPDRPAGRGRKLGSSPVKLAAEAAGGAGEQPVSLRTVEARRRLADRRPDLIVVVAYGLILSPRVLAIPRLGCWNVHASLLPRWRGAAPIQRALLAGDAETGVGLMQMEAGLDTGPVLLERRTPIGAKETGGSLHDRLAVLGAEVLREGLARLLEGRLPPPVAQ